MRAARAGLLAVLLWAGWREASAENGEACSFGDGRSSSGGQSPTLFEVEEDVAEGALLAELNVRPANASVEAVTVGGSEYAAFFRPKIAWRHSAGRLSFASTAPLTLPSFPFSRPHVSLPIMLRCNGVPYKVGVIFIRDVNTYAPHFVGAPYEMELDELTPRGSFIRTDVVAVDWDPAPSYNVRLSIVGGNEEGYFELSEDPDVVKRPSAFPKGPLPLANFLRPQSAQNPPEIRLRLLRSIDFDSPSSPQLFQLKVAATDGGSPPLTNTSLLTIRVRDNDDRGPQFSAANYRGLIPQDARPGDEVIFTTPIHAVDGDSLNSAIIYAFDQESLVPYFALDPLSGRMTLRERFPLDMDTRQFYLVVKAFQEDDASMYAAAYVHIAVPEEEGPPLFALDEESGDAVEGGLVDAAAQPLPRPAFKECRSTVLQLEENSPAGLEVMVLETVPAEHVGYGLYLVNSSDAAAFALDPASGRLRVAPSNLLDREVQAEWRLEAELRPLLGAPREERQSAPGDPTPPSDECRVMDVVVRLSDQDDNRPVFAQSSYTFTIPDTLEKSGEVGRVVARDPDEGPNGEVVYELDLSSLAADEPVGFAGEKAADGSFALVLQYSLAPGATRPRFRETYKLRVAAEDRGPEEGTAFAAVTVNVLFSNSHLPEFPQDLYRTRVSEAAKPGTVILELQAVDEDEGEAGEFSYAILGNGTWPFVVRTEAGRAVLRLTDVQLDRELAPSYSLRIGTVSALNASAEEVKRGEGFTETVVEIVVEDENDNDPVFLGAAKDPDDDATSLYNFTIANTLEKDSLVTKIDVEDADEGDNGRVTLRSLLPSEYFRVSSDGTVTLAKELPSNLPPGGLRLDVVLVASDNGSPRRSANARVVVEVRDETLDPPEFVNLPEDGLFVPESFPEGTSIFTFLVKTNAKEIRLLILEGNDNETFGFQNDNLYLQKPLDAETQRELRLLVRVEAKDQGAAEAELRVIVGDVNDNAPEFSRSEYRWALDEAPGRGGGSVLGSIQASDADREEPNNLIAYSIDASALPTGTFLVDEKTGEVSTGPAFDAAQSDYSFRVRARDLGQPALSSVASVVLSLSPCQDLRPAFLQLTYAREVSENVEGKNFAEVTATHPMAEDGRATIAYRLKEPSQLFSVDSATGTVKTDKALDFESQTTHSIQVVACLESTQLGNETRPADSCSEVPLEVKVLDVNDNPPVFDQDVFTARIGLSARVGDSVLKVRATDADSGVNARLSYIVKGRSDGFALDYASGEVMVSEEPREAGLVELEVEAFDHGRPSRVASARVRITINGSNSSPPQFPRFQFAFSVAENASVGTLVGALTATDPDGDEVRYSFSQDEATQGQAGLFRLDPATGELFTAAPLSYADAPSHSLVVEAADVNDLSLSTSTLVEISILGANRHPPVFQPLPSRVFLSETKAPGSLIFKVYGGDEDRPGQGQDLRFSLEGEPDALRLFRLEGDELRVRERLESGTYSLTLVASDSEVPPRTASRSVLVNVLQDRDKFPVFPDLSYDLRLSRAQALPLQMAVFTASVQSGSQVRYEFLDDSPGFRLDADSGTLFAQPGVWETFGQRVERFLVIRATNLQSPDFYSDIVVKVVGDGLRRYPLAFPSSMLRATVAENLPAGTPLNATLRVARAWSFGPLRYWVWPNDTVRASESGDLFTARTIDLESLEDVSPQGVYTTTAFVSNGTHNASMKLEVQIKDENEFLPTFPGGFPLVLTVAEDVGAGEELGRRAAADEDFADRRGLVYSIAEGPASGLVDVLPGGVLVKSSGRPLDREQSPSLALLLRATDQAGNVAEDNVTIVLLDVNDQPPRFDQPLYRLSVKEGSAGLNGSVRLRAVDGDGAGPNSEVELEILQGNAAEEFVLRQLGGGEAEVVVAKALDAEAKALHLLTLRASDRGNPRQSSVATLEVAVEDVNDSPPRFSQAAYAQTDPGVPADFPVDFTILSVPASDPDKGDSALAFRLVDDPTAGLFRLHPDSAALSFAKAPPPTNFTYRLVVGVTDGLFEDTANVSIRVFVAEDSGAAGSGEGANRAPVFAQRSYSFRVAEGAAGASVGQLTASDPDGDAFSFAFRPPSLAQTFAINASGHLSTRQPLRWSRQTAAPARFLVEATDDGLPPMTALVGVEVAVDDLNDSPPTFPVPRLSAALPRDPALPHLFAQLDLRASDADSDAFGPLFYSLRGPDAACFDLHPRTATLTLTCQTDYADKPQLSLEVHVADEDGQGLEATLPLTILLQPPLIDRPPDGSGPGDNGSRDCVRFFSSPTRVVFLTEAFPLNVPLYQPALSNTAACRSIPVSYQLTGLIADHFNQNVNAKGQLELIKPLNLTALLEADLKDADSFNFFTVVLSAVGPEGLVDEQSVRLQLFPMPAPSGLRFDEALYRFDLDEGAPVGSEVGSLAVDGITRQVSYKILPGPAAEFFQIDESGQLSVASAETDADGSSENPLSLVVQAETAADGAGQTDVDHTAVLVRLRDRNDNAPRFSQPAYEWTLLEAAYPGKASVGIVAAEDPDKGPGGRVSYALLPLDDRPLPLLVEATNGRLLAFGDLDRERRAEYRFQVEASDAADPPLSSRVNVTVTVGDVNDNAPLFDPPVMGITIGALTPPGTLVTTLRATDADSGAFGRVSFRLLSYDDLLQIDPDTGDLRLVTIQEMPGVPAVTQAIKVSILAEDAGKPPRWTELNLTLSIVPEGQEAPLFAEKSASVELRPVIPSLGTPIHQASAGLADKGLIYTLSNDTAGLFEVDSEKGLLSLRRQPEPSESGRVHVLLISATHPDSGEVDTKTVSVRIPVIGDGPGTGSGPGSGSAGGQGGSGDDGRQFGRTQWWVTLAENEPPKLLVDLNSTLERQSRPVVYEMVKGSTKSFSLDKKTGELRTTEPLDREVRSLYILRISASPGGPSRRKRQASSTAQGFVGFSDILDAADNEIVIFVNVTDANDNAPVFLGAPYAETILPETQAGDFVATVEAVDADVSSRRLAFSLEGDGSELFAIDAEGKVTAAADLSGKAASFALRVRASDGANSNATDLDIYRLVNSKLALLVSGVPMATVRWQQRTLERRLSERTNLTVLVSGIFNHARQDATLDPKKADIFVYALDDKGVPVEGTRLKELLEKNLLGASGPGLSGLETLQLQSVGEVEGSGLAVSVAELVLIVISILIILSVVIGTCFVVKWWKRREAERVAGEYMVDARSAGPRPFDVQTLDRKTANSILVQAPHPSAGFCPAQANPTPSQATTAEELYGPNSPSSGASVVSRPYLYYDNSHFYYQSTAGSGASQRSASPESLRPDSLRLHSPPPQLHRSQPQQPRPPPHRLHRPPLHSQNF